MLLLWLGIINERGDGMTIDYEDDGIIRWERDGEKKHAELIELKEVYEGK